MHVNPPNIARNQPASSLRISNNRRHAPRKIMGFRTPHVGPLRAVQIVNRNLATSSKSRATKPRAQNSKIPERKPVLPPMPLNTSAQLAPPLNVIPRSAEEFMRPSDDVAMIVQSVPPRPRSTLSQPRKSPILTGLSNNLSD